MTQITWKNIAAPDFKGAMYGMDKAAETLQGAFDPLENLLKEKKALDKQNFETGIKNNNRAIAARLQGMGSLGELNQAAEGDMSLASLQEQHGAMFDPEALKTGIAGQRDQLRQEVYGSGLQIANQAADEGRDTTAGIPVMEQHLRDSGMQGHAIPGMVDRYTQENAFKNKLYAADRDAETLKVIESLGPITDRKQLEEARKQFAGMGNRVNQDQLNTLVDKKLGETRSDTAYGQAQEQFENARTLFKQGQERLKQELTPKQQAEADIAGILAMDKVQEVSTRYQNTMESIDAARINARGYHPEFEEYISTQVNQGKKVYDLLEQDVEDSLWHISGLGHNQGNAAKKLLLSKVDELVPSLGEVDANILVYQAAKDAIENNLIQGKGVDANTLDAALKNYLTKYKDSLVYKNQLTELIKEHENVLRQATRNATIHSKRVGIQKINDNQKGSSSSTPDFDINLPAESKLKQYVQQVADANQRTQIIQTSAEDEYLKKQAHKDLSRMGDTPVPASTDLAIPGQIGTVGNLRLPVVETKQGVMVQGRNGLRELTQAEKQEMGLQTLKRKFNDVRQNIKTDPNFNPVM